MTICNLCNKTLGDDYVVKCGRSFHNDCIGKLKSCSSCSKQMLKKDSEQKLCLACGKSKTYLRCDDCNNPCETGSVIDGEIVCNPCQEKREEKITGKRKCSSCGERFYVRGSNNTKCSNCTTVENSDYVDSMY